MSTKSIKSGEGKDQFTTKIARRKITIIILIFFRFRTGSARGSVVSKNQGDNKQLSQSAENY